MNTRIDVVCNVAKLIKAQTYLGIGIHKGDTIKQVPVDAKVGVDPAGGAWVTHRMTSDEFFAENEQTFDLVFIDGHHSEEQAYADLCNALKCLNDGGVITMHDVYPPSEWYLPNHRCGGVYKAFIRARREMSITAFCINVQCGVGVVQKGGTPDKSLLSEFTYDEFEQNAGEWLNVQPDLKGLE